MFREIRILTTLRFKGMLGLNEALHTDDKKRKNSLTVSVVAVTFLVLLVAFYVYKLADGLISIELTELIPQFLYVAAVAVVFLFSIFSAGNTIFTTKNYDALITLPVRPTSIVISRFLTMYLSNLLLCLILLPGMIMYFIGSGCGAGIILLSILSLVFLPLLPLTISTVIGALVAFIMSRLKKNGAVQAVLSFVIVLGIWALNSFITSRFTDSTATEFMELAETLSASLTRFFPPSAWFGRICVSGSIADFALLCFGSLALFALIIFLIQKRFYSICAKLNASIKGEKRVKLKEVSPIRALVGRELKRYFSISIYITNTIMGYLFMLVVPIALCFIDISQLDSVFGTEAIVPKVLPFVLALTASMMSTTSCSISIEGKNWWILRSLPIPQKALLDSKIYMNLLIAAPFWLVSSVVGIIASKANVIQAVFIVIVPAVYIIFLAIVGLWLNLVFPNLNWDNEAKPVKQSTSVFFSMLIGLAASIVPIVALVLLKAMYVQALAVATSLILLVIAYLMYSASLKKDLTKIN